MLAENASVVAAAEAAVAAGEGNKTVEDLATGMAAEESKSVDMPPSPPTKQQEVAVVDKEAEKEEHERQQRVADSLSIYKAQLAARESGQFDASGSHHSSTWDQASGSGAGAKEKQPAVLYWSEGMDMQLARLVKECCFDFDAISAKMQEATATGKFTSSAARDKYAENLEAAQLTNEACRMRWTELDASLWGVPASSDAQSGSGGSAVPQETIFKICINPAVLGAGHGAQPDFNQLANMPSGMPSYLKAPTAFPSVRGGGDDSDEELELD